MSHLGLALKAIAVAICILMWMQVLFPNIQIYRGSNHRPLTRLGKLVQAFLMTSFCCCIFISRHSLIIGAAFAVSFVVASWLSRRRRRELKILKTDSVAELWPFLCVFDAFVLLLSVVAILRDVLYPAYTPEQHITEVIGICFLSVSAMAALYLYLKRPRKGSTM